MREVFARIERVAAAPAPVLIVGETGTGKELVARAIHNRSRRHTGPFVPVHTGAIPRELVGSELFGHEKGSFTGAFAAAEGKFGAAARGTVFLDEVGTMDLAVQVSLLRVLETYRYTKVGGSQEIVADVRVVAATNKGLLDLVDEKAFREDLYYRLNVFTIMLPPLRERREDILEIADYYLSESAWLRSTVARRFSGAARAALTEYSWPGNVRELRNVVQQAAFFAPGETVGADDLQLPGRPPEPVATCDGDEAGEIDAQHDAQSAVPVAAIAAREPEAACDGDEAGERPLVLRLPVGTRLADAERKLIMLTLEAVRGNKQRAARALGISRRGLYDKLRAYGARGVDTEDVFSS